MQIEIINNDLYIRDYPFKSSSIFESEILKPNQIQKIDFTTYPIQLLINNNEIIFADENIEDLIDFANDNQISQGEITDIWKEISLPIITGFPEPFFSNTNSLIEKGFNEEILSTIQFLTRLIFEQTNPDINFERHSFLSILTKGCHYKPWKEFESSFYWLCQSVMIKINATATVEV